MTGSLEQSNSHSWGGRGDHSRDPGAGCWLLAGQCWPPGPASLPWAVAVLWPGVGRGYRSKSRRCDPPHWEDQSLPAGVLYEDQLYLMFCDVAP